MAAARKGGRSLLVDDGPSVCRQQLPILAEDARGNGFGLVDGAAIRSFSKNRCFAVFF
jgi:hypothetical protein